MTVPPRFGVNPFVGRVTELASLAAQLAAANEGHGSMALLAGEPGIGKTRLAEEAAALARARGMQVLWGRCYEGEGAPAFWPWVEVLRSWLRGRDAEGVRTALGSGAADIAQLVPELCDLLPDLAQPPALESAQGRFRLFDSIAMFLTRAAGPGGTRDHVPLLVILDDLHWADEPSLLLLEFLARDMADRHVLIIGTYRDVEVRRGDPMARTLGELARRPHITRLTLTGLSPPDVARVVAETTGTAPPADLAAALAGETEGNPLFVTELVRLLAAQGRLSPGSEVRASGRDVVSPNSKLIGVPPTVREVIGRRLDRLSVECNHILTVAAVIGRDFGLEVLGRAAELAGGPLLAVLEEAEASHIIAPAPGEGGRYRFSHALIRETLYEDLPAAGRTRLHHQVGGALEAVYGSDAEPHLAELAWHFSQAAPVGEADQAVTYSERAAGRAMRLYAYEEAARHYEVALRSLAFIPGSVEERRCDLLLALGKAYAAASEGSRARDTYREAVAAARRLGAAGDILLARAVLGFCEVWAIEVGAGGQEQISLMKEAVEALGEADSPLRAMLLGHLASRLAFSADRDGAPALLREAEAVARRCGDAIALASVLGDRHWVLWEEDATIRLAAARDIVQLGERSGNPEMTLLGHDLCLVDLIELGEIAAADAEIATCARLAGELRAPFWLWRLGVVRTMRALLDGRFVEAERLAREARAIGERVGLPEAGNSYRGQETLLRYEQGRLGELAEDHAAYAAGLPTVSVEHCVLALIYAETDRPKDARRELDRLAASDFSAIPHDVHWLPALICLSRVCATLGDARHAATLYRLLSPHAHRIAVAGGANVCFGAVSHELGILAATMGHWDAAARHFDDALERNLRLVTPPSLARTRHAYAAMLVARDRPGDRSRAWDLLDQALATARELGMARLEAQALLLQGERLDRDARPALRTTRFPAGLSAREVEVLALVAAGRTNREIAAALVLSVLTVQNHLVAIYRKIDARNRADATAFALRHGLATPPAPDPRSSPG